ncbi:MAG: hypothetical protein IJ217_01000 [Clostridia bacterium]|nr:hypothetical protein [Clostridia bacterium]
MEKGNVLIIFSIFVATFLTILIFVAAIFMSHVNNVLYNFKLDVYSIAKSGIIAVNKNKANTGNFSYDAKTYQKELEKNLRASYDLDENLSNRDKLISKVTLEECKIYTKGQKDAFTKEKTDDTVLHMTLKVKIKPIILRDFLEKIFEFQIHEDVNLNMLKQ